MLSDTTNDPTPQGSPGAPTRVMRNVEAIARLEAQASQARSLDERVSDAIAGFVGTMRFVLLHIAWFAIWATVNTGLVPFIPAFDPYPFQLLCMIVSMEGVLLSTFVLIKQNRMSARSDERAHLDLQVSLLAEQEITKVIQMLARISTQLGIEERVVDGEARDLGQVTAIGELARGLRDRLPDQG
jgi:uncharacterized membrane protein